MDAWYTANGFTVERNSAVSDQLLGIDVRLQKEGRTWVVDEKSQLNYIGRSLPTQALELDYLIGAKRHQGWLFDSTKVNEFFTFVFDIRLRNGATRFHRHEDLGTFTAVIVERGKLIQALANAGLNESTMDKYVRELRSTYTRFRSLRYPAVSITCSKQLAEQPINLVVHRRFLEALQERLPT